MSEPSDEKIELLVRSVLAAVDARLAEVRTEVRNEVRALSSQFEQRHSDVLQMVRELEGKLDHGGTVETTERFARIDEELQQLRAGITSAGSSSAVTGLGDASEPLRTEPTVAQLPLVEITPFPSPVAEESVTAEGADLQIEHIEQIDIDRLTDLLSDRLAHLSLPPLSL